MIGAKYVGNERCPLLYQCDLSGETRYKEIYVQNHEGKALPVELYCGIHPHSSAVATIAIVGDSDERLIMVGSPGHNTDLITAYRTMLFLAQVPELRTKQIFEMWLLASRSPLEEEQREQCMQFLSEDEYAAIMSAIPPQLEEAIMHLRHHGIMVDKTSLCQEVSAGTLALTPFLIEYGVDSMENIELKQRVRATTLAAHRLDLDGYFLLNSIHPPQREAIENELVAVVSRGSIDRDIALGVAIVRGREVAMRRMLQDIHQAVPVMGMLLSELSHRFGVAELRQQHIVHTAHFLAKTYPIQTNLIADIVWSCKRLLGMTSPDGPLRNKDDYIRLLTDALAEYDQSA